MWPLTGVAADEVADRPALAVKIENAPQARPQTGLEQADVVWEEVVEGGITRFVAVFHSQVPQSVGPVRSVRPMDPAIVAPLHGVLAYTGGQQPFIDAVGAAGVQSVVMDEGDDGFTTTRARRAPHNVYGSPETFWAQADDDRTSPPPAQLVFAREPGRRPRRSRALRDPARRAPHPREPRRVGVGRRRGPLRAERGRPAGGLRGRGAAVGDERRAARRDDGGHAVQGPGGRGRPRDAARRDR